MGMNSNATLRAPSFHCLLVFPKSDLQRPLHLPDVGLVAVFARDLGLQQDLHWGDEEDAEGQT